MLQHYGIGKISDVIHGVTIVICVITQDNIITYYRVHSRHGAKAVYLGGVQKILRWAQKNLGGHIL